MLLVKTSPEDSVEICSFSIQKPRPTMSPDFVLIDEVNKEHLVLATNFTDKDDVTIRSYVLSLWNSDMGQGSD